MFMLGLIWLGGSVVVSVWIHFLMDGSVDVSGRCVATRVEGGSIYGNEDSLVFSV